MSRPRRPAPASRAAPRPPSGLLRRFARAQGGLAAVEFALVLPLMAVLYLGLTELTRAVSNSRKVTMLARTLADLTARGGLSSSDANLNSIFTAATNVLAPFSATGATMVISSVGVTKSGNAFQAKVCWSKGWSGGSGGSAVTRDSNGKDASGAPSPVFAANSTVDAPVGYQTDKIRFIRVDVTQTYVPMLGSSVLRWLTSDGTSAINLRDSTIWPVRSNEKKNASNQYPEVLLPDGAGGTTGCS